MWHQLGSDVTEVLSLSKACQRWQENLDKPVSVSVKNVADLLYEIHGHKENSV